MKVRAILAPILAGLALVILGACSPGQLLKGAASAALGGGGPNVAANGLAGRNNAQGLQAQITDQRLVRPQARTIEQSAGETGVRTERVETLTIRQEAPPWLWFLVILGWLLPSPGQIGAWMRAAIFKKWRRQNADR